MTEPKLSSNAAATSTLVATDESHSPSLSLPSLQPCQRKQNNFGSMGFPLLAIFELEFVFDSIRQLQFYLID